MGHGEMVMIDVYAHRGSTSLGALQNTLSAFRHAQELGCQGVETDLRHTADGVIVLFHDHAVEGVPVSDMTFEDLCAAAKHRVATLRDVARMPWTLRWNLEIKTREAWNVVRIDPADFVRQAVVTSFIHDVAYEAADMGIEAGVLVASASSRHAPPMRTTNGPALVVCDWKVLDRPTADAWLSCGWRLGTYGVESVDEHRAAARLGVDLLITDHTSRGLFVRRESS